MLHFILGTAGTGKTTELVARVRTCAQRGESAVFLVPEQYSFEAEKLLYRALGPTLALRVEVLSFTRLCNSVFRCFGGLAGVTLGNTAKYLLMSIAVEELRDTLKIYRKSCVNAAFLRTMVEACGEFKMAGVVPEDLADCADICGNSALREKLRELSMLYGAYQGLIARGYNDPDDDLLRACALLEENNFFAGRSVFVDGFATFMAAEFALLRHIIAQARDVHFAMTADAYHDASGGVGVFSTVQGAVQRLARMAKQEGVAVETPFLCEVPLRYKNKAIIHLSRNFLKIEAEALPEHAGVQIYAASDIYGEIAYVASQITLLVREGGCRYGDVAVVARDTELYRGALESVFPRYGIPFFMSAAEDIAGKLLPGCVLSAVDAVRANFGADDVILFAKSPLSGIDEEDVSLLENYCYTWGIRGAAWFNDFTANPRGMAGPLTEEDKAILARVNAARAAAANPLLHLRDTIRAGTGRSFAAGLFALLEELDAPTRLNAWAVGLPPEESAAFLDESAQLWDILVEILDIFGSVLGAIRFAPARLCELFRLALNAAEVGGLPRTLDQVLVGSADRIRPGEVRAVFVVGAEEGVFPAQPSSGGMFTDAEREEMIRAGVEISAPSLQRAVLEQYFCYFSLTLPSERLWVSYAKADLAGRERQPSLILAQMRRLFPNMQYDAPVPEFFAQTTGSALHLLAEQYNENSNLTASLREVFQNEPMLVAMEQAARPREHAIAEEGVAKALFGEWLHLSPSRIERYYKCPFAYFASDGLRLRPRAKADFSPIESGGVIHNVLQVMVQKYGGKGLVELEDVQLRREIHDIMWAYLAGKVEKPEDLPARARALFGRLVGMLARLLRHMGKELCQSEYIPAAFELPIGIGEESVRPLRLLTADGAPVCVEGVVDRVDVLNKNGRRYIRVVDYKSGAKQFQLGDILYGLNMQMLLYLFTVAENGAGELADAIPGGVLYMPAREGYVSTTRTGSADTQAEREKQWKMSGLLLDDEDSLRGMERDLKGIFIPAKQSKDGGMDTKSSLAGKAEMGRLAKKVKGLAAAMADSLRQGKIAACPVDGEGYEPCQYCDYRGVCGFESGDAVREIAKIDREAFFKLLEEERDA